MNHFSLGDWVDFVRNLKEPFIAGQMQHHLDAGCRPCTKVVRIWHELVDFGSKEHIYHPPDWAVLSVRGYSALMKAGRGTSRMATMARLVFDSFLEPLPAGVRSSQPAARQLLYSAGDLLIDLCFERRLSRVHLTGQVQARPSAGPGVAGLDVLAMKGGETVAQTKSNRFGEFQFEWEAQEEDEHFSVVLKGRTPVVIALPDMGSLQRSGPEL